jgi:hypothetical protein
MQPSLSPRLKLSLLALTAAVAACPAIDTQKGRPYSCDRRNGDADCAAGWHCGLEGRCHDPSSPAAWSCATDVDCEGGWHCGVDGLCMDRLDAGAVACRPDAQDCAPGWRCASSRVCQQQGVALPLACASDGDCEGGWRCGPAGVCLDPSAEALLPVGNPAARVAVTPLHPFGTIDVAPQGVLGGLGEPGGVVFTTPGDFMNGGTSWSVDESLAVDSIGIQGACAHVAGDRRWALQCPAQLPSPCGKECRPIDIGARAVAWAPGLDVTQTFDLADLAHSLQVTITYTTRDEPMHGALAPLPDGGRELLVSLADSLWAADVSGVALPELISTPADADAGTPASSAFDGGAGLDASVDIRLVPVVHGTITSLMAGRPDADAGAGLLRAWVLASERLIQVKAARADFWSADELVLPLGDPLALWTEGDRARVGFVDGTVYALPSLLPLAPPLADAPVQDYAALCGSGFVLGQTGVWALAPNPDGGGVGVWAPVDLSAFPELVRGRLLDGGVWDGGLAPGDVAPPDGLLGGRLLSTGTELFLFRSNGDGYAILRDGGC